jgi:hypothetical protein
MRGRHARAAAPRCAQNEARDAVGRGVCGSVYPVVLLFPGLTCRGARAGTFVSFAGGAFVGGLGRGSED